MRRLMVPAALAALLTLAACAETPRTVVLPAAPPTPTARALDGLASGSELADARMALDTVVVPGRRPDLVAVAREGFACWEDAASLAPRLSAEAEACRADFWGAVHALGDHREIAAR